MLRCTFETKNDFSVPYKRTIRDWNTVASLGEICYGVVRKRLAATVTLHERLTPSIVKCTVAAIRQPHVAVCVCVCMCRRTNASGMSVVVLGVCVRTYKRVSSLRMRYFTLLVVHRRPIQSERMAVHRPANVEVEVRHTNINRYTARVPLVELSHSIEFLAGFYSVYVENSSLFQLEIPIFRLHSCKSCDFRHRPPEPQAFAADFRDFF